MGRPSDYTEAIAVEVCTQLAEGSSLVSICKNPDSPSLTSVYRWLNEHEAFRNMYARAREEQADTLADEIMDISDTPVMGFERHTGPDGEVTIKESEMLGHRRLQVDARKWIAAKLKPRKYGDRLDVGGSGVPLPFVLVGTDKSG